MIRIAADTDLPAIVAIYNEAIASGCATADAEPVSVESRRSWFLEHEPTKYPIFVWEQDGEVLAWCSASPYRRGRQALRFTAEISYYVAKRVQRRGIASALIDHVVRCREPLQIKTLFAIVLQCNAASCALLEKHAFERWGFLPRVADFEGEEYGHIYYGRRLTPLKRSTDPETTWPLRLACESDIPALETLIPLSARSLQSPHYSQAQIDAALGPIFGVDRQLIRDGTYFVVEHDGTIIGCGGWSRRRSLYGGDNGRPTEDDLLDPHQDPARVRAFFIHPAWARRGIGRSIMLACEQAIKLAGFNTVEIVATLAGEPLYTSFGYGVAERYEISMAGGLSLPVVRMTKQLAGAEPAHASRPGTR